MARRAVSEALIMDDIDAAAKIESRPVEVGNAWMTIHSERDAISIRERQPRPRPPALDVSGQGCVHQTADAGGKLSEPCGRGVDLDHRHGFLCWFHFRVVNGLPIREDRDEGRVM